MRTERLRSCSSFCVLRRVEQFGRERKRKSREKGRAGKGKRRIKEEGRVTFFILGDLDGCSGGSSDAAFSTSDQGEKGKEKKKGERGTRDGMDLREGRTCAAQFQPPLCPVGKV